MSQGSKLMPNLDQQSTKLLNLTVLQRMDAFIEEILITAAHVTFYEFNIDSSQWSRKDVEGSLFVVKRNAQPRFQFIVMNRRNADNLVENLLGDFEFEIQVPYLLYRNATQEVNGIWFYNARECEEVSSLFNRILNAYAKVPQLSKAASIKSEFEELEAVPTMAVMDGPLEPSESPPNNVADLPDDPAFVNFFSSALNIGNAPISAAMNGQPFQSSATLVAVATPHRPPLMASLVAAPPNLQMQSPLLSASTPPRIPFHDTTTEAAPNTNNIIKNLVKPSFFAPPLPSSNPMAAAIRVSSSASSMPAAPQPLHHPPTSPHRPYGAPILQSFPPPTPPPSLTPNALPAPNYGPVISRDKVRDALLVLVQDNQFIDMVYRAVLNAHNSRGKQQQRSIAA